MFRVVSKAGQYLCFGTSTDTMPAPGGGLDHTFIQIDTGRMFRCANGDWEETTAKVIPASFGVIPKLYMKSDGKFYEVTLATAGPNKVLLPVDRGTDVPTDGLIIG